MFGGPGVVSLFITIIILVFAILAILMPLFVYQIRNQCKDMGQKMDMIIKLLARQSGVKITPKVKECPSCGAKNRMQDFKCIRCGKSLFIYPLSELCPLRHKQLHQSLWSLRLSR